MLLPRPGACVLATATSGYRSGVAFVAGGSAACLSYLGQRKVPDLC